MLKKTIVVMIALMMAATLLVACGDKDTETQEDPVISETNAFIETTADGGVVEQDSDGNIVTKDKSGNILAVKDSSGNTVDIETYIESRRQIENARSADNNSGSGDSNSSADKSKKSNSNKTTSSVEEDEGEIPVVIGEMEDDEEQMMTIPDL